MKIARLTLLALLFAAVAHITFAADAVAWDSSGDSLLSGTYNFREVMWGNKGDQHRVAIYGTIQFDGIGGYTLTSSVMDSNVGAVQSFSAGGAYRISASGMGFLDDPIRTRAASPSSTVWGFVSAGEIFIGSSTDDGINNLFIATKGPFTAPGNPNPNDSFKGPYWAAAVNIPSGVVAEARDMLFRLDPDGQGNLGTVNLSGLVGSNVTTVTQTLSGATYSIPNETLNLNFGGSAPLNTQTLIAGSALCYLSRSGDFFFGGSPNGWDMIVGVRAITDTVSPDVFTGTYFQVGADVTPTNGFQTLSTYHGAFSALGASGILIGHERILPADSAVQFKPYDFTYSDTPLLAPDGTYDDFLHFHHVSSGSGTSNPLRAVIQIGVGTGSHLGINLAVRGPFHNPSDAYLDPYGIANAASSAPFSAGVSRGGFIALYGNNLASAMAVDSSMPTTLGGVQVLINGRAAPLYYVRSDVVLGIVPFATTESVAAIQVINNGVSSETRTVRVKDGTPGIFTSPTGGVGYAVAQHVSDNSYSLVTPENPARPGEMILVYLAGLGDVTPPVADGVAAPSNPPSASVATPIVLVDGEAASSGFAGLWPGSIGVYGITFTVPSDITAGDKYLDISLPDSYTTEAQIPIGSATLRTQSVETRLQKAPNVRIPSILRRFPDR
jgi:uncharacterized protein (TIGR03437 family)